LRAQLTQSLTYINQVAAEFQPLINAGLMAATFFAVLVALYSAYQSQKEAKLQLRFRCNLKMRYVARDVDGGIYIPECLLQKRSE
jgi:hypothetical protein